MLPPSRATPADVDAVEEITWMLWSTVGLIAHRDTEHEQVAPTPPPALEQALNGGPNPLIGRYYADVLTESRALPQDARILDVGCGYGRIARELIPRMTAEQSYLGLDPNAEAIEWAQSNVGTGRSNVRFERIDVASKPYNPRGVVAGTDFRFPCDDDSLDLVFMISVLTHVDLATVDTYIREAARTLKPDTGRFVATFFLLDEETEQLISAGRAAFSLRHRLGESRVENRANPELVIAHPRARVLQMLSAAGFADATVRTGHWIGRAGGSQHDYQDLVIADLRPVFGGDDRSEMPTGEIAALREIASALIARGIRSRHEVMEAVLGAMALSVNASWWQNSGLTLAPADPAAAPFAFDFTWCSELRLADAIPGAATAGSFVLLGEEDLLQHIRAIGPLASAPALIRFFREAVRNGALVRDVLAAGSTVVLRSPGRPDQPVSLR